MRITQPSPRQILPEQLHNLLSGEIDNQGLMALSQSASQGNLDDIDLLHNLALRRDELGHKAENILFDIFSGKIKGKEDIALEIQKPAKSCTSDTEREKSKIISTIQS